MSDVARLTDAEIATIQARYEAATKSRPCNKEDAHWIELELTVQEVAFFRFALPNTGSLLATLAASRAECEAMRAVVEAAVEWRCDEDFMSRNGDEELIDVVDEYLRQKGQS